VCKKIIRVLILFIANYGMIKAAEHDLLVKKFDRVKLNSVPVKKFYRPKIVNIHDSVPVSVPKKRSSNHFDDSLYREDKKPKYDKTTQLNDFKSSDEFVKIMQIECHRKKIMQIESDRIKKLIKADQSSNSLYVNNNTFVNIGTKDKDEYENIFKNYLNEHCIYNFIPVQNPPPIDCLLEFSPFDRDCEKQKRTNSFDWLKNNYSKIINKIEPVFIFYNVINLKIITPIFGYLKKKSLYIFDKAKYNVFDPMFCYLKKESLIVFDKAKENVFNPMFCYLKKESLIVFDKTKENVFKPMFCYLKKESLIVFDEIKQIVFKTNASPTNPKMQMAKNQKLFFIFFAVFGAILAFVDTFVVKL
jgi:hypothetical protein